VHVFDSPPIIKRGQIENNFIFRLDLLGKTKQHFPAQEERSPYSGIEELGNLSTYLIRKLLMATLRSILFNFKNLKPIKVP
jgi:hypothetical protein